MLFLHPGGAHRDVCQEWFQVGPIQGGQEAPSQQGKEAQDV